VANPARSVFVSQDDIDKVIDQWPDAEWRLIVALSRYGGLRCPSEHLALRWEHVLWDIGRINVISPKTEHVGKPERVVPLFPGLEPFLRDAFE
jgi:integrase